MAGRLPRKRTEVDWATGIIPDFQISKMHENIDNAKEQKNVENGKRNRSADNSAVNPPKRTRTAPSSNKSFAELAKGKRILAIVDRSDSDGKISRSQ